MKHENKDDIDLEGWDLHRAAKENRVDIARLLINHDAELEARDENGCTPLHIADSNNSLDLSRLLRKRAA